MTSEWTCRYRRPRSSSASPTSKARRGSRTSLGAEFAELNEAHRRVVRAAVDSHGGREVSTHGDAFFVVFSEPAEALRAAGRIHTDLKRLPLRVRIGLHVGSATVADGTYLGTEVNRAARIGDAGHGGQTLVSAHVRARVGGESLLDLGTHRLKGFIEPVTPSSSPEAGSFPPPRTLRTRALPARPAGSSAAKPSSNSYPPSLRSRARLVTVVGAGGTGKTRLVVEAAARWETEAAGVAHWIPLADVEQPGVVRLWRSLARSVCQSRSISSSEARIGRVPRRFCCWTMPEHLVPTLLGRDRVEPALGVDRRLPVITTSHEQASTWPASSLCRCVRSNSEASVDPLLSTAHASSTRRTPTWRRTSPRCARSLSTIVHRWRWRASPRRALISCSSSRRLAERLSEEGETVRPAGGARERATVDSTNVARNRGNGRTSFCRPSSGGQSARMSNLRRRMHAVESAERDLHRCGPKMNGSRFVEKSLSRKSTTTSPTRG